MPLKTARPFIVLSAALVSACAGLLPESQAPAEVTRQEPSTAAPAETTTTANEVAEVHAAIDGAVASYRDAMTLIEEGNTQIGSQLIDSALAALEEAVTRCRNMSGCDQDHAITAYQTILNLQTAVFETGEIDAAEPAPSEEPVIHVNGTRTLNGSDLSDVIQLNRYVKDAIHDWLTWNRPNLIRTYENYQFLRGQMLPIYEAAGLPEALLFGILAVESTGKVHSYSRVGAAGPLQFMRATARRYGLQDRNGFDERLDPARATEANVAYLNDQFRRLGYSLEKTLAAYNAGENRVYRLHRRLGGVDFWDPDFFYSLPRDTRRYVPQVMAAAWLYLHPDDYNLSWPARNMATSVLTLQSEISVSELAICLGNDGFANGWFRALRNLNPELNPGDRLKSGDRITVPDEVAGLYEKQCRDESMLSLAKELRDASESRENDLVPYAIRRGDTLSQIARRYRCISMKELAAINNIKPPRYLLRAGKVIKVPNC